MAITTNAICNSFKKELLEGAHKFQFTSGSTFKLALYKLFRFQHNHIYGQLHCMDHRLCKYQASLNYTKDRIFN